MRLSLLHQWRRSANPSIERTATGKRVSAAHVKRVYRAWQNESSQPDNSSTIKAGRAPPAGELMMSTLTELYDQDFYAWTQRNANLLRQGRAAEIDWEHLAEEIEEMGKGSSSSSRRPPRRAPVGSKKCRTPAPRSRTGSSTTLACDRKCLQSSRRSGREPAGRLLSHCAPMASNQPFLRLVRSLWSRLWMMTSGCKGRKRKTKKCSNEKGASSIYSDNPNKSMQPTGYAHGGC